MYLFTVEIDEQCEDPWIDSHWADADDEKAEAMAKERAKALFEQENVKGGRGERADAVAIRRSVLNMTQSQIADRGLHGLVWIDFTFGRDEETIQYDKANNPNGLRFACAECDDSPYYIPPMGKDECPLCEC
jgi:hypothetical protein